MRGRLNGLRNSNLGSFSTPGRRALSAIKGDISTVDIASEHRVYAGGVEMPLTTELRVYDHDEVRFEILNPLNPFDRKTQT